MYLIRSIPGSCGDIVTAVLDDTGMFPRSNRMEFSPSFIDRTLLKNIDIDYSTVVSEVEKLSLLYKSISCQLYIESIITDTRYKSITIDITDDLLVEWCLNRLDILFPKLKGKITVAQLKVDLEHHRKFSNISINLLDILQGNLINKLNEYNIPYNNSDLYFKWLELNTKNFPYSFV